MNRRPRRHRRTVGRSSPYAECMHLTTEPSRPTPGGAQLPILLLSGPNLNLLGARQPEIYGTTTLDDLVALATDEAAALGFALEASQHNHEGSIVEAVHAARTSTSGIIINPGAFTHYSYALHDALAAYDGPKVELHLSNPSARDEFRKLSVVAAVVNGTIAGFGAGGYRLAVQALVGLIGSSR